MHNIQHSFGGVKPSKHEIARLEIRDEHCQQDSGVLADQREDAGNHSQRSHAPPSLNCSPHMLLSQQESQEVNDSSFKVSKPFNSISRKVRSRLYSRLYSQDRYVNVIKKSEFKSFLENKLNEPLPFADEFDR